MFSETYRQLTIFLTKVTSGWAVNVFCQGKTQPIHTAIYRCTDEPGVHYDGAFTVGRKWIDACMDGGWRGERSGFWWHTELRNNGRFRTTIGKEYSSKILETIWKDHENEAECAAKIWITDRWSVDVSFPSDHMTGVVSCNQVPHNMFQIVIEDINEQLPGNITISLDMKGMNGLIKKLQDALQAEEAWNGESS